jgi:hypothetical protein
VVISSTGGSTVTLRTSSATARIRSWPTAVASYVGWLAKVTARSRHGDGCVHSSQWSVVRSSVAWSAA